MADIKTVGQEVIEFAIAGAIGFGGGCLGGYLGESPVLMTGGVYAIYAVAIHGLRLLTRFLAEKYEWNFSTVKFLSVASNAVFMAALIVTSVALGILNPTGGIVMGALFLSFLGFEVARGLYVKFAGKGEKDLPYLKALKSEEFIYKLNLI
ncbi:MAG: hypothetical protein K940chlam7_00364 [Chlamydiae bacterium]|nr:hypothetical protein [Chlamydiota bacterium]